MSLDATRVEDAEVVARFLFDRGDFTPATGRVRPRPFLPTPDGATSVFRTDGLAERSIWDLAVPRQGREAKARGSVTGAHVRSVALDVHPVAPPDRHASIVGWPAKDAQLSVAQQLAAHAKLDVRSDSDAPQADAHHHG